ncbi:6517_t:CDS:2, partial [Funneliformis mosseae]
IYGMKGKINNVDVDGINKNSETISKRFSLRQLKLILKKRPRLFRLNFSTPTHNNLTVSEEYPHLSNENLDVATTRNQPILNRRFRNRLWSKWG